jgi:hypothetical protein
MSTVRIQRVLPRAGAILIVAAGLGGWAVLSADGSEANTSEPTSAGARLEQSLRYAGGEQGRTAVEKAIDDATEDMSSLVRGVARRRLREANPIIEELGFSLSGDPLRASWVGGRIIETPASGEAVDWTDQFGDDVKVSQRWSDGELVQRMFDDNGSRTNVYRFSEDGQRMTMSVTIEASRLPEPIRYRLEYRKQGS